MKQRSGQSQIGPYPSWAVNTNQVGPRLCWHSSGGFTEEVTGTGPRRLGRSEQVEVGGWVSTPGRETEGTRSHRKGTLFSQPQVGGRTQLQGSQHSVKDTELFLKIAVPVYPFFLPHQDPVEGRVSTESQNLYSLLLPACSPHGEGNKVPRVAGRALGRRRVRTSQKLLRKARIGVLGKDEARLLSEPPTLSTKKEEIGAHPQRVTSLDSGCQSILRTRLGTFGLSPDFTWEEGKVLGVYEPWLARDPWRQLLVSGEALNPGLRSRRIKGKSNPTLNSGSTLVFCPRASTLLPLPRILLQKARLAPGSPFHQDRNGFLKERITERPGSRAWLPISHEVLLRKRGQAGSGSSWDFTQLSVSSVPQQPAFRNRGKKSAHFLHLLSQKAWRLLVCHPGHSSRNPGREASVTCFRDKEPENPKANCQNERLRWEGQGARGGKCCSSGQRQHLSSLPTVGEMQNDTHLVCLPSSTAYFSPGSQAHSTHHLSQPGTWRFPDYQTRPWPTTQGAGTEALVWVPAVPVCAHSLGYTQHTHPAICVSGSVKLGTV